MRLKSMPFDGFTLRVPSGWHDITKDLESGSPLTLALPDGVGVLQFFVACYEGGPLPNASARDLEAMLDEFADFKQLTNARDRKRESTLLRLAATTFASAEWTVRVWYVSDGKSFAKATYTVETRLGEHEVPDAEAIVRSITWP